MALGKEKFELLKTQLQAQQAPAQTTATDQPTGDATGLGSERFEELKQALQQQQQPEFAGRGKGPIQEIKGIGTGIAEDFRRRREQARATAEAQRAGEQTPAETTLQAVGQGIGLVGDVAGRALMGAAEAVTPEFIERPIARGFEQAVGAVAGTQPAQNLIALSERIKTQNPRLARNIEAILSVGEAGLTVGTGGAAGAGVRAGTRAAGQVTGRAAKTAGKAALRGTGQALRLGKEGVGLGGELLLGTQIAKASRTAFDNPGLFEKFAAGERTIKSVGKDVVRGSDLIANDSFDTLARVKKELPKFQLDRNIIENNVNDIIDDAFIDTPRAEKVVKRLRELITKHNDYTPEGLLNLNTIIRREGLYKPGVDTLQSSNRIVRDVTREFKQAATEVVEDQRILGELERASNTIRFLEDLGYTFKVKPEAKPDQINKALVALSKKIDDPNQVQDAKALMEFIKDQTGFDLERQLSVFRASEALSQDISQGDIVAGIRQAAGRVIAPIATGAGRVRQRLTGVVEPRTGLPPTVPRQAAARERAPGRVMPWGPALEA
jgi:hypothetical protein